MTTPTVVTVRTVHLYLTEILSWCVLNGVRGEGFVRWSAAKRDRYLKFANSQRVATFMRR
ncbi:MAG: hypothetical protein E6K19_08730 [Methanobacteriota archaeon]|nr:MAG: hypothetical protein E6K19_08730 [Euryarchaeota archaeon]